MPAIPRRSALTLLAFALPLVAAGAALGRDRKPADDADSGIPNLFISPCGEPFRAPAGAPYPVIDWFHEADTDHDGKLEHDEFVDDARRFFKKLDLNGDGVLSRYEILVYEHKWVPEILAGGVSIGENQPARLWLAQYGGGGVGSMGGMGGVNTSIDPSGDQPMPTPPKKGLDVSGEGASPYSFFQEPEPIMTADFNFNGIITLANFLKVADMHFTSLDYDNVGYLTLKTLPETAVEKLLAHHHRY